MPKTKTKNKAQRTWLRQQVLGYSLDGVPRTEIAEKLGLSLAMVDYYLKVVHRENPSLKESLGKKLEVTRWTLLSRLIPLTREYERTRLELEKAVTLIEITLKKLGYEYDWEGKGPLPFETEEERVSETRYLSAALFLSDEEWDEFERDREEVRAYTERVLRRFVQKGDLQWS